jgi:hypothetical protein
MEQRGNASQTFGRRARRAPPAKTVEQHYTLKEVSALLGVDVSTVRRQIDRYRALDGADGIGPIVKLGRRTVRVPASAVARFLKGRTV